MRLKVICKRKCNTLVYSILFYTERHQIISTCKTINFFQNWISFSFFILFLSSNYKSSSLMDTIAFFNLEKVLKHWDFIANIKFSYLGLCFFFLFFFFEFFKIHPLFLHITRWVGLPFGKVIQNIEINLVMVPFPLNSNFNLQ